MAAAAVLVSNAQQGLTGCRVGMFSVELIVALMGYA
jgi:hypothetical protein